MGIFVGALFHFGLGDFAISNFFKTQTSPISTSSRAVFLGSSFAAFSRNVENQGSCLADQSGNLLQICVHRPFPCKRLKVSVLAG